MKWQTLVLLPIIFVGMVWMFYLGQEDGKKRRLPCPEIEYGVPETGIYAAGPCEMGVVVYGEEVLTVELRPCEGVVK